MKKNKGFTIVELLAVIMILGVLSLIAVGATTKFLTQSQETAYLDLEDSMNTSAENYLLEHMGEIPSGSGRVTIQLSTLIDEGYSSVIQDPKKTGSTCDGYVVVRNKTSNSSFNLDLEYQACLKCGSYQSESCS